MRTYRFCFVDDHVICGRFDFQADDGDQAAEIAEILFHACSDRCQSFQIWDGNVFLSSGPKQPGVLPRLSDLTERRQRNIVECEETIKHSEWTIASSERLLAELDKLRATKKDAFRYSLS